MTFLTMWALTHQRPSPGGDRPAPDAPSHATLTPPSSGTGPSPSPSASSIPSHNGQAYQHDPPGPADLCVNNANKPAGEGDAAIRALPPLARAPAPDHHKPVSSIPSHNGQAYQHGPLGPADLCENDVNKPPKVRSKAGRSKPASPLQPSSPLYVLTCDLFLGGGSDPWLARRTRAHTCL